MTTDLNHHLCLVSVILLYAHALEIITTETKEYI